MHLGETLVFHEPFHLRYTDVRCHLSAPVVNVNTWGRFAPRFEYVHHAAESHLCTLNRFFDWQVNINKIFERCLFGISCAVSLMISFIS